MALAGTRVADIFAYDPRSIVVDPDFNPRNMEAPDTLAHVAEIAASIRERGFDPDRPLLGRKAGDTFIVTDGHCRLLAVRTLIADGIAIKGVPCRSEPAGTSREDRQLLSLRSPGKPLTAIESAVAIKKLVSWGWTEAQIAAKLGKSKSWISDCLDLAAAPVELRQAVEVGQIAKTEAVKIARKVDPVATLRAATDRATADGSNKVRARHVEEAPTLNAAQKAIVAFLAAWDATASIDRDDDDDVSAAIENLRRAIP